MTEIQDSSNSSNSNKKPGFFEKIFGKKKSKLAEQTKPADLKKSIEKQKSPKPIEKTPVEPVNKNTHFLDKIHKIDEDIQIGNSEIIAKEVPKSEVKSEENFPFNFNENKKSDSIEDISYSDDGLHVDKLRKALGIVKQNSDKDIKIKKFKESLFNTEPEEDIVTDLAMEKSLEDKVSLTPLDLVKQNTFDTTIDSAAPENSLFILADGTKLRTLKDLQNILHEIDEILFSKHVYGDHNDFSVWVNKVFNDSKLANIIERCKSPKVLLSVLDELEDKQLNEELIQKEEELIKDKQSKLKDLEFIKKEKEVIKKQEQNLNSEKHNLDSMKSEVDKLKSNYESKLEEISEENSEIKQKEQKVKNEEKEVSTLRLQLNNQIKENKNKTDALKAQLIKESRDHVAQLENKFLERTKELEAQHLKKLEIFDLQLANKKNVLDSEYKQKLANLEKDFVDKKKDLEQQFNLKEEHLNNIKEEFKQEQRKTNDLYHKKLKELKLEEENLYKLQKDLKSQELKLLKKSKDVDSRLRKLDKKLSEAKNFDFKIRKDIEERDSKLLSIRKKEANLRNKQIDLERNGFHAYLNQKLKEISSPGGIKSQLVKLKREETDPIYQLIDICKSKISNNEIDEAQKIYSEIRNQFYRLHLSKDEKSMLFNSIRELYADINISLI